MAKIFKTPFVSLIIACIACSSTHKVAEQGDLYKSSAFTPAKSFTKGAEGPAVDKSGMLYAVNFDHEGTVGMVTPTGQASIF